MNVKKLMAVWLLLYSALTNASEPEVIAANLQQLQWLTGTWQGEALGGQVEEIWLPVRGDHMLGAFRLLKEGRLAMSEQLLIRREGASLTLYLRHFGPQLQAFEGQHVAGYPLRRLGPQEADFYPLSFTRRGNALMVRVSQEDSADIVVHYRLQSQ